MCTSSRRCQALQCTVAAREHTASIKARLLQPPQVHDDSCWRGKRAAVTEEWHSKASFWSWLNLLLLLLCCLAPLPHPPSTHLGRTCYHQESRRNAGCPAGPRLAGWAFRNNAMSELLLSSPKHA